MPAEAFTEQGRQFVESLRRGKAAEIPVPPATEEEARDYFRSLAFGFLARNAGRATKTGRIQAVSDSYELVLRLFSDLESPVRERRGDEFVLRWPTVQVEIGVRDLRDDHGDLTAEITVRHAEQLPLATRSSLVRIRSRTELERWLKVERPGLPWSEYLAHLCSWAVEAYRTGTPVTVLDAVLRKGPRCLVDPLVEDYGITVFYADGGSGKGYLALLLALSASHGVSLVEGIRPSRVAPVLYLDWESSGPDLEHRLALLGQGLKINTAKVIHYRRMVRPITEEAGAIRAEIARSGIGLVIVDSLAPACGYEPEGSDSVLRTLAAIRSFGVPAAVTAHVSKEMAERKGGVLRPYGSVFVWNLARSCWEVRRSRDQGAENEMVLELYHRKINEGPQHAPVGLRFAFDPRGDIPTSVTVAPHQISVDDDRTTEASASQRILLVMHTGNPMTADEIAHAVDRSKDTTERTLRRLREQGRVANSPANETDGDRQLRWVKTAP